MMLPSAKSMAAPIIQHAIILLIRLSCSFIHCFLESDASSHFTMRFFTNTQYMQTQTIITESKKSKNKCVKSPLFIFEAAPPIHTSLFSPFRFSDSVIHHNKIDYVSDLIIHILKSIIFHRLSLRALQSQHLIMPRKPIFLTNNLFQIIYKQIFPN